jgi:hypothetical protein
MRSFLKAPTEFSDMRGQGALETDLRENLSVEGAIMKLKRQHLFLALIVLATAALSGCAGAAPGEPCWGFFACTGWH